MELNFQFILQDNVTHLGMKGWAICNKKTFYPQFKWSKVNEESKDVLLFPISIDILIQLHHWFWYWIEDQLHLFYIRRGIIRRVQDVFLLLLLEEEEEEEWLKVIFMNQPNLFTR